MADTTMKVSTGTRDRIMKVAATHFGGVSADKALQKLLDEHWKATCIAQADRLRDEEPAAWQEILEVNELWDRNSPDITEAEGPYRSEHKDAA